MHIFDKWFKINALKIQNVTFGRYLKVFDDGRLVSGDWAGIDSFTALVIVDFCINV